MKKILLLFIPFLVTGICFIGIYSFLDWQFYLDSSYIKVDEDVIRLWLPMGLSFLVSLIWINPRLKRLNFKKNNRGGDPKFGYLIVASMGIAIPTIVTQTYLATATGKLTHLHKISEINTLPKTKYYDIKNVSFGQGAGSIYLLEETSGKHNQNLDLNVYFTLPVIDFTADTTDHKCDAWFGYYYTKTIDNDYSASEADTIFYQFEKECIDDLNKKDLNKYVYLERLYNNSKYRGLAKAVANNQKYHSATEEPVILMPVNEPFEARNSVDIRWTFGSFGIASLLWLIMISFVNLKPADATSDQENTDNSKSSFKEIMAFIIPGKGRFATMTIFDFNVLIFLIMVISGVGFLSFDTDSLLKWGANFRPVTEGHNEWWRLITNTFLHGGFLHIMMNMFGLIFVGVILEPALGRDRFFIIYLVTGVMASLASLYGHQTPVVSVGASGAIFGMYGVFFAFLLLKVFPPAINKVFLSSTILFIGYNLILGLMNKGVDNAAHIGGLASGLLIGLLIAGSVKREKQEQKTREF